MARRQIANSPRVGKRFFARARSAVRLSEADPAEQYQQRHSDRRRDQQRAQAPELVREEEEHAGALVLAAAVAARAVAVPPLVVLALVEVGARIFLRLALFLRALMLRPLAAF